jgi:hypothetical protein
MSAIEVVQHSTADEPIDARESSSGCWAMVAQTLGPRDRGRSAAEDSPLTSDEVEIRRSLTQLIGLKLAVARRAADMRVLHFGTIRPALKSDLPSRKNKPRGSIGDFALHIQCPWRIESDNRILTGRSDLWEPVDRPEGSSYVDWDYENDGNLQDQLIAQFISNNDNLLVETISVQPNC